MMGKNAAACRKKQRSANAPFVATLKKRFKVIHLFHPHSDRKFELLNYRNSWKNKYIDYTDSNGILRGQNRYEGFRNQDTGILPLIL